MPQRSPSPQQHAPQPAQNKRASPLAWLQPLTRWWGVIGLIVFVGIVMRLAETPTHWLMQYRSERVHLQRSQ